MGIINDLARKNGGIAPYKQARVAAKLNPDRMGYLVHRLADVVIETMVEVTIGSGAKKKVQGLKPIENQPSEPTEQTNGTMFHSDG